MKIQLTDIFTFIVSTITALGGYKGFEFLINKIANKRKADLKIKDIENEISIKGQKTLFDFYKNEIEYFKEQFNKQESQFNQQQRQINVLEIKVAELKKENEELKKEIKISACIKYDCPNRKQV